MSVSLIALPLILSKLYSSVGTKSHAVLCVLGKSFLTLVAVVLLGEHSVCVCVYVCVCAVVQQRNKTPRSVFLDSQKSLWWGVVSV